MKNINKQTKEKEKIVKMVEIEMDLDANIIKGLVQYAKVNIINDKDALINWAVNHILKLVYEQHEPKKKVSRKG